MRARSEAEHLYTAAAVAGFGAVAWGVAALQSEKYVCRPIYERPAVVAAIGILGVTVAIWSKIVREHKVFEETKEERIRIANLLEPPGGPTRIIPEYMFKESSGRGYVLSIAVLAVAAIAGMSFCLFLAGPCQ
ncbi:MAG TPA: hypothetical protein VN861_15885 [Candidatus Acidoferrales bacterium]|nr:hypothetical protein [Candidatus Acidoferrales bacterium]